MTPAMGLCSTYWKEMEILLHMELLPAKRQDGFFKKGLLGLVWWLKPPYSRGRDQEDHSPSQPGHKARPCLKINQSKKGWVLGSSGRVPA
jgi:hypothetical protein